MLTAGLEPWSSSFLPLPGTCWGSWSLLFTNTDHHSWRCTSHSHSTPLTPPPDLISSLLRNGQAPAVFQSLPAQPLPSALVLVALTPCPFPTVSHNPPFLSSRSPSQPLVLNQPLRRHSGRPIVVAFVDFDCQLCRHFSRYTHARFAFCFHVARSFARSITSLLHKTPIIPLRT